MNKKYFLSLILAVVLGLNGSTGVFAYGDDQPPVVSNLEGTYNISTSDFTITVDASDLDTGGSSIVNVMYSISSGPWVSMLPKDGAFDSESESAFASVVPLVSGLGLGFCVQALDNAGNVSEVACASATRPFISVSGTSSQSYGNKFFRFDLDLQRTASGGYLGSGKVEVRTPRSMIACNLRQFYSVTSGMGVTTVKSITNCSDGRVRNLVFTLTDNPAPLSDQISIVDVTAPELDLSTQSINNGGITLF